MARSCYICHLFYKNGEVTCARCGRPTSVVKPFWQEPSFLLIVGLLILLPLAVFVAVVVQPDRERQASTEPEQAVPKYLTEQHRSAINARLRSVGYPAPVSLEINGDGWLVATFELRSVPSGSFRSFGENAVVAIREVMLPFHLTDKYRATVNGPPPGTGLIRRYGSARFIEGGEVQWKDGV